MKITYKKHTLPFKVPATTSRGAYQERELYVLELQHQGNKGIGECAPLPGLSIDAHPKLEEDLIRFCEAINASQTLNWEQYESHPAFLFALESAYMNLKNEDEGVLFPSDFTTGEQSIPINGLIWMAPPDQMKKQIDSKLEAGFMVIKLKIGALDFDEECRVLEYIRSKRSAKQLEIRVDANGAFTSDDVFYKLKELKRFHIHSIEQPVATKQWELMSEVCDQSPIPVALDEELIGVMTPSSKKDLLKRINPNYLILKPTLLGGFRHCDEWIGLAREFGMGWWATSALESNIGLNAIAQWVATKNTDMAQGLGTGQLFVKNFESPLTLVGDRMWFRV